MKWVARDNHWVFSKKNHTTFVKPDIQNISSFLNKGGYPGKGGGFFHAKSTVSPNYSSEHLESVGKYVK